MFASRRGTTGLELLFAMAATLGIIEAPRDLATGQATGLTAGFNGSEEGLEVVVDNDCAKSTKCADTTYFMGYDSTTSPLDSIIFDDTDGSEKLLAFNTDAGTVGFLPYATFPSSFRGVMCSALESKEQAKDAWFSLPEVGDTVLLTATGKGAADGLDGMDLRIRGHASGWTDYNNGDPGRMSYGQCWVYSGLSHAGARVTHAVFAIRNGHTLGDAHAAATMIVGVSTDTYPGGG